MFSHRITSTLLTLALSCLPALAFAQNAETAPALGENSVKLPEPMTYAKELYASALKLNEAVPSADRDAAILKQASEIIDYDDLAKRAFADKWASIDEIKQTEFLSLFKKLMELTYLEKVGNKKFSTNYKIDWDKASKKGENAIVSCFIQQKDVETELEFVLKSSASSWKLFDVLVDGASLEATYRKKYGKIFDDKGYDGIVKDMKTQISKLEKSLAKRKK